MVESDTKKEGFPISGGCTCGQVRYQLTTTPLFVHCCHCTWCQRETGSAFVINALIENSQFALLPSISPSSSSITAPSTKGEGSEINSGAKATNEKGKVLRVNTPSASGKGQVIMRCSKCLVACWSEYGGVPIIKFVRVGTLDEPGRCPPSIHIYTETKQSWVKLDGNTSICQAYYDRNKMWPKESLERRERLRPEVERYLRL